VFCTPIHKFAQTLLTISIDAPPQAGLSCAPDWTGKLKNLTAQFKPRNYLTVVALRDSNRKLLTLRFASEGAISLTACWRGQAGPVSQNFTAQFKRAHQPNGRCALNFWRSLF
jgi:hypothetical protein